MSGKHMALGGILTALTIVILYLTLLIPTNTLTLLTLASFMVPVALMRSSLKTAFLVYISSSLLCLLLIPSLALLYVAFFGCYGIVKYFIERLDKYAIEWVLKLAFFNVIYIICFKAAILLFGPSFLAGFDALASKFVPNLPGGSMLLLWLAAQIVFVVFDYALTLLVDLYYKYFGKLIK